MIESALDAAEKVYSGEYAYADTVTLTLGDRADMFAPENPEEERLIEKLRLLLKRLPEAQRRTFTKRMEACEAERDFAGAEFWKSEIAKHPI